MNPGRAVPQMPGLKGCSHHAGLSVYSAHLHLWGHKESHTETTAGGQGPPKRGSEVPPKIPLLQLAPNTQLCAFPDRRLPTADEPTSPKKVKSVPKCHDLQSWFSPPSPEWATVRIIPEEEMTEHNLLAIRVMVTSDASRYFKIQVSLFKKS